MNRKTQIIQDILVCILTSCHKLMNCFSHPIMQILFCKIWGSRSGGYEEFYILGYNTVYPVALQLLFSQKSVLFACFSKLFRLLYIIC
jgi:hypothetical protein